MKHTLTFTTIFSSVLLFSSAFAQETWVRNTAHEPTIPAYQQITLPESYSSSFQAVVFTRLNGHVSVNVQKARHETVWVHIYTIDGQLLTQDKLGKRSLITKEYSFQGLTKGTYTFKIVSSGKVYSKEVVIN